MRVHRSRRMVSATAVSALILGSGLTAATVSPVSAARPIPTGLIVGTVAGPGGAAVPGAAVELYNDLDNDGHYNYTAWTYAGPHGDYLFGQQQPGNYKLYVSAPGFQQEWYHDATTLDLATPLAVGAGQTTFPTVALAAAAPSVSVDPVSTDLTGILTDAATGRPIADAAVDVYDATTGGHLDDAMTDSAGRYAVNGLEGHPSVKAVVYDGGAGGRLGYQSIWSGGARSKRAATPITLTPGTPVTFSAALTQHAGLSGKVLNPAGVAPHWSWVTVFDADSRYVEEASVRADGTFFVGGLNPGEEYRVQVGGGYYPGDDYDNEEIYYIDAWYADGNNFTTATPVVAGASGTFTPNVNVNLRDSLVALEAPSISGDFVVGKTLTANRGRWNRNANAVFGVEWLRGATVVSTASTYTLTGADAGQPIALRVTLTTFDDTARTATVTTAAGVAKFAATVSAKKGKTKKGKTSVLVAVKAAGQAPAGVTGTVTVTKGKKKVGSFKVKSGKVTFSVSKPGKHKYQLVYSGSTTTLKAEGKATITVKSHKKKGKKR